MTDPGISRRSFGLLATAAPLNSTPFEQHHDTNPRPITFQDIPAIVVSDDTWVLETIGYSVAGTGAARYRRLPEGSYVPSSSLARSANGIWFELNEITPNAMQFGALANGHNIDSDAIESAIEYMQKYEVTLNFPSGNYKFGREIFVRGHYFSIKGSANTVFASVNPVSKIDEYVTPDLRVPRDGSPGVLSGSGFIFSTLIYYAEISGIVFRDFRFGMSFLAPHNTPCFRRCGFENCNVAVFCYTGSQNFQFYGCSTRSGTGNLFVAASTCFNLQSEYAGKDNYFCDGLFISNDNDYGTLSCEQSIDFDAWFQASILRPKDLSYAFDKIGREYPFSSDDACCSPSGRAVYLAYRNQRTCFQPTFRRVDLRGKNFGGLALINTSVHGLKVDGLAVEGAFRGYSGDKRKAPWLTLGSVISGHVKDVLTEVGGDVDDNDHAFYRFTGVGYRSNISESENFIIHEGCEIDLSGKRPSGSFFGPDGPSYYFGQIHFKTDSSKSNFDQALRAQNPTTLRFNPAAGISFGPGVISSQCLGSDYIAQSHFSFDLPALSISMERTPHVLLTNDLAFGGELKISVLNLATQEWDFGVFQVYIGQEANILLKPLSSGDSRAYIAVPPRPFVRPGLITVGGVKTAVDYYEAQSNSLVLTSDFITEGPPFPIGTKLDWPSTLVCVKNFSRGYIDVNLSSSNLVPHRIEFINRSSGENSEVGGQSLRVFINFSSLITEVVPRMNQPPQKGAWDVGTIVLNSTPAAKGFIGWVCTHAGKPGTWRPFGLIE